MKVARFGLGARFFLSIAAITVFSAAVAFFTIDSIMLYGRRPAGDARVAILGAAAVSLILLATGAILAARGLFLKPLGRLSERAERAARETNVIDALADFDDGVGGLSGSLSRIVLQLREDRDRAASQLEELRKKQAELESAQEKLVNAERLAAAGVLAAGIAHEIGNPLSSVIGYVELLRSDLSRGKTADGEALGFLDRMDRELTRINRIIRELLDYSRPMKMEMARVDPLKVAGEVADFLQPQKGFEGIAFEIAGGGSCHAFADRDRLYQVFLNLFLNAAEAMGGSGTCRIRAAGEGGFIRIEVSDTGRGLGAEEAAKVFEPFYTNKKSGTGTGLGLAVTRRMVDAMGGAIKAGGVPGAGSTFSIFLRPADG